MVSWSYDCVLALCVCSDHPCPGDKVDTKSSACIPQNIHRAPGARAGGPPDRCCRHRDGLGNAAASRGAAPAPVACGGVWGRRRRGRSPFASRLTPRACVGVAAAVSRQGPGAMSTTIGTHAGRARCGRGGACWRARSRRRWHGAHAAARAGGSRTCPRRSLRRRRAARRAPRRRRRRMRGGLTGLVWGARALGGRPRRSWSPYGWDAGPVAAPSSRCVAGPRAGGRGGGVGWLCLRV